MLDNAFKYEEELKAKFLDTWYDPKYQYYYGGPHREPYGLPKNGDYYCRTFVSLNADGEVIGMVGYSIDNEVNRAHSFGAINFSDDIFTFSQDLRQVIDDIFIKFGMNKMEFNVICGNPIEKSYDRIVQKIGGRILCIRKDTAKLLNGTLADDKMYEIMRSDYIKFKERSKHNGQEHDSGSI